MSSFGEVHSPEVRIYRWVAILQSAICLESAIVSLQGRAGPLGINFHRVAAVVRRHGFIISLTSFNFVNRLAT
jgi:hypothetical protein